MLKKRDLRGGDAELLTAEKGLKPSGVFWKVQGLEHRSLSEVFLGISRWTVGSSIKLIDKIMEACGRRK